MFAQSESLAKSAQRILETNCVACHGAARMSDLDVRSPENILTGGKRGPAIVPGKASESLLLMAVRREGELRMPLGNSSLKPLEVSILSDWIDAGAPRSSTSGCEFGRTPTADGGEGRGAGRDHNPYGFTLWMVGGGVRGGQVIGSTDELGLRAAEYPVHLNDLHASILELLGLDHAKLTYRHSGRDFRLTDVGGKTDLAAKLRNS